MPTTLFKWVNLTLMTGACVFAGSCARKPPATSALQVTIDTVEGVERVTSVGSAPMWKATLRTRIGAAAGDGPDVFGDVWDIELDAVGNVYVADEHASQVQVFDSLGTYIRSIGRRGAGPGELQTPRSLGWLGDTLVILDFRNARIALFSRAGGWITGLRWQPLSGERLRTGSLHDLYAPVYQQVNAVGRLGFIHLDAIEPPDTVVMASRPGAPSGPVCRYPNNGGIEVFGIPFGPIQHIAGGPAGTLWFGWSAEYRLAQTTTRGDTVRLIDRSSTPLPILDTEWADATARFRGIHEDYPGTECDPSDQARPPSKPAFRWLGSDVNGRLWTEVDAPAGYRYEVFDARGRLLGQVVAGVRTGRERPVMRDHWLAIVAADSLDVEYVELYSLSIPK
jgi:hypothetical protein